MKGGHGTQVLNGSKILHYSSGHYHVALEMKKALSDRSLMNSTSQELVH